MKAKICAAFAAIWLGCVTPTHLSAQQEDIISRSFTMKDGLSHDFAYCMLQDSQGFLWVGTQSGLNKFDGYNFTTYLENPSDSNSLANNRVHCLWEDQQQRLWIGTLTGLDLFDLKAEKFHRLIPDSLGASKGITIDVHKIRERKDGKIWICTDQGIYLADPETLSITRLTDFTQGISRNNIRGDSLNGRFWDIVEAPNGSIWAASDEGLVYRDPHTGQTTGYRNDPGDPHSLKNDVVWTLHIDNQDRVWVGTADGLDLFNPDDQSFTHFLPEQLPYDKSPSPRFRVNTLMEQADGKFWIGGHELYAFDPESGKFDLLVDEYIASLFKDRQGIVWAGSYYGMLQMAPQSKKFTISRQFGQTEVSSIFSLGEDNDNHMWISSHHTDYQLFRFDPTSKKFFQYLHDPENPHSYSGDVIYGVTPDSDGGVWMASFNKLEKFNPQDQTFSSIALPLALTAIFKDSKGKIWLGGWIGVGSYDLQTETYEPLAAFPRTTVYSFLEDREENLWIGTITGLVRYSLRTGQLDVFENKSTDAQSLSNNKVYHLMMDQEGTIWVGTGGGLNQMIPGTEKDEPRFIHWQTTDSNLPHDDVNYVIDEGDGTLWLSCGNMISHFFPQAGIFRNYDHNDGLPGQRLLKGLRSRTGEIYFGSIDGLIVFHPDSLQDNPYSPPVSITGFFIHNQPVPVQGSYKDTLSWETPMAQAMPYTDTVELTYRQNDFSLEFASLNFVNPESNLYKYKLEPYEEDWIETSASNRIARYTNISPGQYTFRVIGSNNDGLWNETGQTLSIIVQPPWWQTWWAYVLYCLALIGVFLYWRSYEIKRVKLKHRAEHLSELDHLKSRFFANISHEFRTPLTLILGPIKKMMDKYGSPDDQSNLSGIQRNAQRLLHLVNQLLDLSKLEAGKLKLEAVKSDIVGFVKSRANAFTSLADQKRIRFSIELPSEKIGVYFDRDKLEKIINNLLSNALKFAPEEGSVKVKMQPITKGIKDWVQIQVKDSGKGITAEEVNKIFDRFYQVDASLTREQEGTGIGLSLTKELVELHHGEIKAKSNPGRGTTFTLLLPLGKDHLNEEEIIQELPLPEEETGSPEPRINPSELLVHPTDILLENEQTEQTEEKPLVLIVEDQLEMRKFIRASISDRYQVQEAEDGVMGLETSRELVPDLIISDVMMPEMDGYTLCEKIKTDELTSHIPVILLTAKADRQSKLTGLQIGADDYLSKPFDGEELQLIVRNRIEERRKMRERFSRDITLEPKHISITSLDEQFLAKVLDIIEVQMADEYFTIEALSQQAGYSHMHFYRKIKALSGQTPSQFLRTIRLKRAAAMLQKKSDQVTQIAYGVGFKSLSYFNKCFKDQFGMTPGQYAAADQTVN